MIGGATASAPYVIRTLAVLAGTLLAAERVEAQRVVHGVVLNHLGIPVRVVNAEVTLLGEGRTTRTDSAGRFSFRDVSSSSYGVAHWGPWLDSLGLPPLRVALGLGSSVDLVVTLETPRGPEFQQAMCGSVLGAAEGILLGEVRDPGGLPQGGVVVFARWTEITVTASTVSEREVATTDTTTESGRFSLCSVPLDTEVLLRAAGTRVTSGQRALMMSTSVLRRDLVVARAEDVMTVAGNVVDENGKGMVGARVSVRGEEHLSTLSNAAGEFMLTATPRRSGELLIRALGHEPLRVPIEPSSGDPQHYSLQMRSVPPQLETVVVSADPFAHERRGFEERRRGALGRFVTEEMLSGLPDISPDAVASMVPLLRTVRSRAGSSKPLLMLRQGSGTCAPRFFTNGVDDGRLVNERAVEQWSLLQRAKRIEVYTASQAPARYNDNDGCGSIVVWTR